MTIRRCVTLALLATLPTGCTGRTAPTASRPSGRKAEGLSPRSAAELVGRARRAAEGGDDAGAARLLDQALAAQPSNPEALRLSAIVARRQAARLPRPLSSPYYLRSAAAIRALREARPTLDERDRVLLATILYDEACALAAGGETARAIESLSASFDAGLARPDLFDNDGDLDPLRDLPAFQEVRSRVEGRHAAGLLARPPSFAFDFTLKDADGKTFALADFKGKVVVVEFWGTWCPPCRKEVPHLAELYRRYHDRGVAVVGLNYEAEPGEKARGLVRAYVKAAGIPYPCLIGDDATRDRVRGFEGYPTALFLDRRGKVRASVASYQPLAALEALVEALLAEERAKPAPKS